MHGAAARDVGIDLPEEAQVLLVAMAALALSDHGAGRQVQSRKQSGGAMANVVVGHTFHIAQAHGRKRLGTFQGLNLALLIDAQDHRFVRRVQIQRCRCG